MRITDTSDLWWKNAVIYCLDVETFTDSNGDGHGDFQGLSQQVDYLADLGVTCIWLMPFYPTPGRDDGYDISDFYGVDPRLGTLGDFVEFMRTAHDRGMRVIADLVANHTSDQHPWFQSARAEPGLAVPRLVRLARRAAGGRPADVAFPDEETSVWEYDEQAGQYYLHRFYQHQPDLNVANPEVRDEIAHIAGFWIELGVCRASGSTRCRSCIETDGSSEAASCPTRTSTCATCGRSSAGARASRSCSARSTCRTSSRRRSSATTTATSSRCCSTSSACRRSTCRWPAATPRR